MDTPFECVTLAEIVEANRRLTTRFGGRHALMQPGSLEHALARVHGVIPGDPELPTATAKAAFLCLRLAQGHFFFDGNKRTAFWTCTETLHRNGFRLSIDLDDVVGRMVAMALKEMDVRDVERWLLTGLFRL
ncbi:type II toxin-antitoxin system death-on-curing family toxin [Desulfolutivibrio sp.]|uniref:type II toxin-antitoxin system death-on-curing family toxin n=1 Tax=Desulfolutivibrio sp. TaxID=2773296 RepID=UPI002F96E7E3